MGAFAMTTLMQQLEKAFLYGSKVVSAVVEASDTKKKTKWVSELEIGIVAKVSAVPKKDEDGLKVSEQEQQLREGCAELMATKLVLLIKTDVSELEQLLPPPLGTSRRQSLAPPGSAVLREPRFHQTDAERREGREQKCLIHGCGVAGAKGDQAGRRGCPRNGARNGFGGEGDLR